MERDYEKNYGKVKDFEHLPDGRCIEYIPCLIGDKRGMRERLIGVEGIQKIAEIKISSDTPDIRNKLKKRLGLEI